MPCQDPLSLDLLAERIFLGFLKPAAETDVRLWRERYKIINRGAGVVAGLAWAIYAGTTASLMDVDHDRGRCAIAEEIVSRANALMVRVSATTSGEPIDPKTVRTLCFGLRKRVAKCLLAMEGVTAPQVVS